MNDATKGDSNDSAELLKEYKADVDPTTAQQAAMSQSADLNAHILLRVAFFQFNDLLALRRFEFLVNSDAPPADNAAVGNGCGDNINFKTLDNLIQADLRKEVLVNHNFDADPNC